MPNHVEISTQAERDRDRLDKPIRRRLDEKLRAFYDEPLPANLDVDPMTGCPPWKRARSGQYRIIYRGLDKDDLAALADQGRLEGDQGYLIGRIVHRSDLEEAGRRLRANEPLVRGRR